MILYKQPIIPLDELFDILMNGKNDHLVFLWSTVDSRSILGVDS